jgi:hypothetical protein
MHHERAKKAGAQAQDSKNGVRIASGYRRCILHAGSIILGVLMVDKLWCSYRLLGLAVEACWINGRDIASYKCV